jgi:Cu(I)/Ag(I) efflux system protein CusF
MKALVSSTFITVAVALVAPLANAADNHGGHGGHDAMHKAKAEKSPLIEGEVKKLDKVSGKITISHGPLPNGMPAMTMTMPVKNTALLDKLKAGDKVSFASENIGGTMTIVQLDPVK